MYDSELYKKILLDPIKYDLDTLNIVTGYATSAMAFHHLNDIVSKNPSIKINLLLGMCVRDGLSLTNHKGFQSLMSEQFRDNFSCNYLMQPPPVHSKIYVWIKNNKPKIAFLGSANYTQTAFFNSQRELMSICDPEKGLDYYQKINSQSIFCNHLDSESYVTIYKDIQKRRIRAIESQIQETEDITDVSGLQKVTINLYDRKGDLPDRSGLNWGQRPEEHREPNQAYIRIPMGIAKSDFFPTRGVHFTLLTDDDKVLICTRAQDSGKAIHTPHNNSLIGEYFRNRLKLPNGVLIQKEHIEKYGRNTIDVYKIDDETYYLDYSAPGSG